MNLKELKRLRRIEDSREELKSMIDIYPFCEKHKEIAIYQRDGSWFCSKCLDEQFERYRAFDESRRKIGELIDLAMEKYMKA